MKLLENKSYQKLYNKMKEGYTFGFCPINEIDKLTSFLNDHWKKNYSLCMSRKLMDWQFKDEKRGVYNFLVAKNREDGDIHGIMGVIPSNGAFEEGKPTHFYLSILKTLHEKSPVLTMFLYCYMEENFNIISCSSNSFGHLGEQVFRKIGFKGSIMDHYYIVNKNYEDFKILDRFDGVYDSGFNQAIDKELVAVEDNIFIEFLDTIESDQHLIEKSKCFYMHRYIHHPIYQYKYLAIYENAKIKGVFIYRILTASNKCIKIIDFLGDENSLLGLSKSWQQLLQLNDCEYADIYTVGLDKDLMTESGFLKRSGNDGIIIPHYFEPFVRQNIELVYGVNTESDKKLMLFRGDGDQDRPQIIK